MKAEKEKDNSAMGAGILLINTGTPEAPTAKALRPWLAQFLSDRRVIEYPRWWWLPLLHGIILRVRPRRSARLYRNIWTERGSPLLLTAHRQARSLQQRLEAVLGDSLPVAVGMRYGQPSVAAGLRDLKDRGVRRVLAFPLFPQYSATTTASMLDAVFDELKGWRWMPELRTITHYYHHPAYIHALVSSVRDFWNEHGSPERLLFSFHGIPQSYAAKGDPYEEQCRSTARLVAEKLGLPESRWEVAFQSRFGPEAWLQPYTDELLGEWGRAGIRSVQVLAPGFSADCLETLDELGREGRETFRAAGGGDFQYIPALNERAEHIQALVEISLTNLQGWVI